MRKLILFNMATLDGFFAGPNGEIDWHRVDEEFNQFAIEQMANADALLFGRVTYEMMAGYWPTPAARADDPEVAGRMNDISKFVASRTLARADWENTRLINQDIAAAVAQLKQQPGKDMLLFGSANLAATLTQQRLIDEYRIMVNPVVLGRGKPLFEDVREPLALRLLRTRTFRNGNVLLSYEPEARSTS
jgi:dihydrofolate reductase